jgi:hypothetical protein
VGPDEFLLAVGPNASRRRPTGEGLRRAVEGGVARTFVCEGRLAVSEGVEVMLEDWVTGSEGIEGDERVRNPACELWVESCGRAVFGDLERVRRGWLNKTKSKTI